MPALIKDVRAYYEARIIRMPIAGCWLWTGPVHQTGYGILVSRASPHRLAHRFSWSLFNGPLPNDQCVLHKCDVRLCVNPNHLFLGSRADNAKDRRNKNREGDRSGSLNGRAKLTESDVLAIRSSCCSINSIAKNYQMSWSSIKKIKAFISWKNT